MMKEKNLREALEKCSKAELIEIVLKASGMTFTSFSWLKMISEIKLNKIESLIDANLAELNRLDKKLKSIPEERRVLSDDEARSIMIDICDNNEEYFKLQKRHDKIFKQIYD